MVITGYFRGLLALEKVGAEFGRIRETRNRNVSFRIVSGLFLKLLPLGFRLGIRPFIKEGRQVKGLVRVICKVLAVLFVSVFLFTD